MAVAVLRGPLYPSGEKETAERHVSRNHPPSGCGKRSSCSASGGRDVIRHSSLVRCLRPASFSGGAHCAVGLRAAGCGLRARLARPGTRYDPGMAPADTGFPGSIGAPATRALVTAGYTELTQLANVPASELKKLHGMGPKALRLLQEALEQQGMSLG